MMGLLNKNILFSEINEEVLIKINRVRRLIDEEQLNAVFLQKHINYSWITAGETSVVTQYLETGIASVLITREAQYVITNIVEAKRLKEEQRLEQFGFQMIVQNWYEDKTIEIITDLAGDISKVGSDVQLGNARVINPQINPLRYSLTKNEVARYNHLGTVLSTELEKYIMSVKPGMTEFEIAGGLSKVLWNKNIEQVLYLVSADYRAYDYRHGIPTNNVLKRHLNISVNGRYKGLITTVTRMVHFGPKDNELIKQFEDTCEIECRTISAIKIGTNDISAYYACKKAYEDMGYGAMWNLHSQGGPQGYCNRDYTITEKMNGITRENQCYCFNPVIDGTKSEDAFIATSTGPKFITRPIYFPIIQKEINGVIVERPGLQFVD